MEKKALRVNNTGVNTSFGRIIRLNPPEGYGDFSINNRVFGNLYELENVLNSRNSSVYTKNEANKIRDFFKKILGDYNGKNGIMIKKAFGDTVVISGEDVKKVRELELQNNISYSNLDSGIGKKKRRKEKKKGFIEIAEKIRQANENGAFGKPDSIINKKKKKMSKTGSFDSSKFKKFEYEYMHQKTNSVKYDDEPGAKVHGALRSIVYEADTLEF